MNEVFQIFKIKCCVAASEETLNFKYLIIQSKIVTKKMCPEYRHKTKKCKRKTPMDGMPLSKLPLQSLFRDLFGYPSSE